MDHQEDLDVIYHFRDKNNALVERWRRQFAMYPRSVKVTQGDIFVSAPTCDAIVSPANSFGFMDGGIDKDYVKHFGPQLQTRLQKAIRDEFDGELLVGQAAVVSTYGSEGRDKTKDWSKFNGGATIKYLIAAPTMRISVRVPDTPNAYLAFRAVILAVRKHNRDPENIPIEEVLVPGLCSASGGMPLDRCAWQMLQAYETFAVGQHPSRVSPQQLKDMTADHNKMCTYN